MQFFYVLLPLTFHTASGIYFTVYTVQYFKDFKNKKLGMPSDVEMRS
jgi:hypothetical protein